MWRIVLNYERLRYGIGDLLLLPLTWCVDRLAARFEQ